MSSLILDSLEIRNFRTFRNLKIDRLARVNLIVGENNVGKTTLLEALQLYACRGEPTVALKLLAARDEVSENGRDADKQLVTYNLFYGRQPSLSPKTAIQIGSLHDTSNTLTMLLGLSQAYIDDNRLLRLKLVEEDEQAVAASPALAIQLGTESEMLIFPLKNSLYQGGNGSKAGITYQFIPATGLDNRQMGKLWDKVTLTDAEKELIAALRLIAPEVQHLSFVNHPELGGERLPKVRVAVSSGKSEVIPLRSMGEGMVRLLGLVLGLVNAKDGLLLIDEFSNGLHHLVQVEVWRIIFELASRLNVQVFATTHSRDTVEAFQRAGYDKKEVEGFLFSLRNKQGKPGEVVALLFDEEDLEMIAYPWIEVR